MKKDLIISILVSGTLGALIWLFSPYATGMTEPWDAETPYYFICLFSAGLITGILCPRHIWVVLPSIVIGQLLFMFILLPASNLGPLIIIGVLFMFLYGLLTLFGAFAGAATRRFIKGYVTGANNRA